MPINIHNLRGKRAAIMGLGLRSGVPLIRFLVKHGCTVVAFDKKPADQLQEAIAELQGTEVELVLGDHYLDKLQGFDYLFRTPIMRTDLPEITREVRKGAILTSEIELLFDLAQAPITGITGSDGKTTTTALVYEIIRQAGHEVYLGGNIGQSLIEQVLDIPATAMIVLELSSFQLMSMQQSPHVAVFTNISPNHLDVHSSYEEYIEAKENIWRFQNSSDVAVLNWDDPLTQAMGQRTHGQAIYFSRREELEQGVFLKGEHIVARFKGQEAEICCVNELKLKGKHNWENIAAAACACLAQGIDMSSISEAVTAFAGVEHRLEPVREIDGACYYNDSIASSPTRTIAGLDAIGGDIVLIAGGSDKYVSFDAMAIEIINKVRAVALIGATAPKIAASLEKAETELGRTINKERFQSLADAVLWCRQQAQPGSNVMLSPACASFDMFKSFEDRGRQFKKIVNELQ